MPRPHAHGLHSIHCHQFDHRICDICRLTRTPRVPPAHHTRLISPRASTIWPFCIQRRSYFLFRFPLHLLTAFASRPCDRHHIRLYDFLDFSAWSVELCRIGAPCAARSYACPKPLEFVSSWCISKYTYARIDCIGDTPTPVFGEPSCIVFICCVMLSRHVNMVAIAQLVEHLIVVQKVARSSRVSHPGQTPRFQRFPNRTNPGFFSFR